jgi:hypothetical protein
MVRLSFRKWMESKIEQLNSDFISTEFIVPNIDEESIAKPFMKVLHESENCLGQIVVYDSREIDYEVVNVHSGEMVLWKYFENVSDCVCFDEIFEMYFDVLHTGIKSK